jgi:hypothetical protein
VAHTHNSLKATHAKGSNPRSLGVAELECSAWLAADDDGPWALCAVGCGLLFQIAELKEAGNVHHKVGCFSPSICHSQKRPPTSLFLVFLGRRPLLLMLPRL